MMALTRRNGMRLGLFGLATILFATTVSACSPAVESQNDNGDACDATYTIGFSHPDGDVAYVASLKGAIERAAKQDPCLTLLMGNTVQTNLEDQRATIESWVTQEIDAIVIIPADLGAFEGLREKAQAQGTKWIVYAAPQEGADGFAGFDSDDSGRVAGKAAADWLEENYPDADVSAAITTTTLDAFDGRNIFAKEAMEAIGVPVVSYQDCNTPDCGLQITEDTLREHPNLRIFIGVNDDAALGAARAFKNSGIDLNEVFIVGQDGGKEALEELLKEGPFRASVALSLDDLAAGVMEAALNAITGDGSSELLIPAVLASQDNPEEVKKLLAQFGN